MASSSLSAQAGGLGHEPSGNSIEDAAAPVSSASRPTAETPVCIRTHSGPNAPPPQSRHHLAVATTFSVLRPWESLRSRCPDAHTHILTHDTLRLSHACIARRLVHAGSTALPALAQARFRIVGVESTTVSIVKTGYEAKDIDLSKNASEQDLNTLLGTMRQKVCS